MSLVIKISAVAVAIVLLSSLLKGNRPEFVLPLQLCGFVIILAFVLSFASDKLRYIVSIFSTNNSVGEYIAIMLKGVFVCVTSTLASSLCREGGNIVLADSVEIAARIVILVLSVPLIEAVASVALSYVSP